MALLFEIVLAASAIIGLITGLIALRREIQHLFPNRSNDTE